VKLLLKLLNLVGDVGRVERQRAIYVLPLLVRYRLVCIGRLRREEPPRHEPRQTKYTCTWHHQPHSHLLTAMTSYVT